MKHDFAKALEYLQRGKIIAYPTDTTYGIGCDAQNESAVEKIFKLKGRDYSKPLSLAFSDLEMMSYYADISDAPPQFLQAVFPGPVTLLLSKKNSVSDLITAGKNTVGVRIPDYPDLLSLIKKLGHPIITTSANASGHPDSISAGEIELPVDYILRGCCKRKKPSTIIDIETRQIVRAGVNAKKYQNLIDRYL